MFVGSQASLEDVLGESNRLVRWVGRDERDATRERVAMVR
jgi:hypothetical protein